MSEYIMAGGNIEQAFYDLYLPKDERKLVYRSSKDDFCIYEVSKNVVNTLYSVPNQKWSSRKWGWWVYSKLSYTMNPTCAVKINGTILTAWINPEIYESSNDREELLSFASLKDYADRMWNKTSDHTFINLAVNLAKLNNMSVLELFRCCSE